MSKKEITLPKGRPMTKKEQEKFRIECIIRSPEYKEISSLLEAQREVSGKLSEEIAQLKGDRSVFKNIIDEIAEALEPGLLRHQSIVNIPGMVRQIVIDVEYHKGAAKMAHTLHNSVVDKLVETVQKSHLQMPGRGTM